MAHVSFLPDDKLLVGWDYVFRSLQGKGSWVSCPKVNKFVEFCKLMECQLAVKRWHVSTKPGPRGDNTLPMRGRGLVWWSGSSRLSEGSRYEHIPERRDEGGAGGRTSVNEPTREGTRPPSMKDSELWVNQLGWSRSHGITAEICMNK